MPHQGEKTTRTTQNVKSDKLSKKTTLQKSIKNIFRFGE